MKKITKTKTKIIITIIISIIVVVSVALGFTGNYFYKLAIDAYTDKSIVFGPEDDDLNSVQASKISFNEMMDRGTKDIWIENKEGYKLHGYELRNESNKWIVVVHGYTNEAKNMSDVINHFSDNGYNVLAPDLRSHGQSEGNKIGMGLWDSEDIIEWCNYILEQDSKANIGLYGISMGASTVMMASANSNLPSEVKVIIEDCGYTSAWDEFSYQLKNLFNLPSFPVLDAANIIIKLRAGYNLKDVNALEAVKNKQVPMLFIHGDEDDFVPTQMVYSLYESSIGEKELLIVKGAEHAKSRNVDPDTYWGKVDSYLKKYL